MTVKLEVGRKSDVKSQIEDVSRLTLVVMFAVEL